MSDKYNLVVIGAGSAGLVSAYIAATVKAKVALIERHKMGGDCLNTGCVPSKALIRTAKLMADIKRHRDFGIRDASCSIDFAEVMGRVHRIVAEIEPNDSVERYTKLGVECFSGSAELIDAHTVRVGDRVLKAKNIILAIGASPFIPPIKGLMDIKPLTSENLWDLKTLPKRLVVLGGGPIGSEMTQAFVRLGSEVTQIEMAARILPREDEDVSQLMAERFRKEGVNVMTNVKAEAVVVEGGEKQLVCRKADGSETRVPFDEILVAVGRRANTDQFDWDSLGIKLHKNGTLVVDEYLRVNGRNIFACGDAIGPYQFTHTAAHEAWFCAVNALFGPFKRFKVDYSVIPWVTFTDPEVAMVGHNELSAKAAGIPYEVTIYNTDHLDRAICESENHGFVKVLTRPGKDRVIGATIVSHNAGEMITEFVTAMKRRIGLSKILGTIHSYPTYSEANKYLAGRWKANNKPEALLGLVEKFHAFRRG